MRGTITFELAFTPGMPSADAPAVYILIDVLRATSAMAVMLKSGARSIVLVADDASLETARDCLATPLVCAENHDGSPASNADFSPSLKALKAVDLRGRDVILRSTNGTLAACATIARPGTLLTGALLNATAVMKAAIALTSETAMRIVLVCSGRESAKVSCLDDVYCAGYLINVGVQILAETGQEARLRDSAKIGVTVYGRYASPLAGLTASESAEVLRRIGCDEDIVLAARPDDAPVVPLCSAGGRAGHVQVRNAVVARDGVVQLQGATYV